MTALLLEPNGTIKLPKKSLKRYGFEEKTPIRVVETKEGVLLIPLTNQPMSDELKQEISRWQEASSETWEEFPYESEWKSAKFIGQDWLRGGREQSGRRPSIILQKDTNLPTVLLVPLTTQQDALRFNGTVLIEPDSENNSPHSSVALDFQLTALDKNSLERKIGKIS